jgi:hypothetical protein
MTAHATDKQTQITSFAATFEQGHQPAPTADRPSIDTPVILDVQSFVILDTVLFEFHHFLFIFVLNV